MGTTQQKFFDKVPLKETILERWTVTVGEDVHGRWFSAITALAEAERLAKEGKERVRFGWNIEPTKKARCCCTGPDMTELVENVGLREAKRIMEMEGVVNG